MTPLRNARRFSAMVVLLAGLAWLAASNHCAFAALRHAAPAAHSCCAEKKPAKSAAPSMQCCGVFNVPIPEQVTVPQGQYHFLKPVWVADEPLALSLSQAVAEDAGLYETGPPRAASFAESVLNRSLLAHAPPIFVA